MRTTDSYSWIFFHLKQDKEFKIEKRQLRQAIVISNAGIATFDGQTLRLIETPEPTPQPVSQPSVIAPNPTPSAPQQHVQVQWWLSGARQGAYSQETYSVIESDNKWTAFHDALGRKHVVATDRVRFVASRKDQKAQKAQVAA